MSMTLTIMNGPARCVSRTPADHFTTALEGAIMHEQSTSIAVESQVGISAEWQDELASHPRPRRSLEERLLDMVARSPFGCWEWAGCKSKKGYGKIGVAGHGNSDWAHRVAYRLFCGPIPDGICVCHACDNPACCNPCHLWLGTKADNNRDMASKGRRGKYRAPTVPLIGERNALAKLTAATVISIRAAVAGGEPQKSVAKRLGISRANVCLIVGRKSWKHI